MGKVRIYDLAKELKLESKKVLEDARRLGVDVSVPSNTLDDNIAAKIRENYYPKKEPTAIPRAARLIKHPTPAPAPAPVPATAPAPASTPSVEHSQTPQTVKKTAPDTVKAEQSQTTITQLPNPRPVQPPMPTVSKSSPAAMSEPLPAETKPKEVS